MRVLGALSLFAAIAMLSARTFWTIIMWHAIVSVTWSTLLALGETVTMAATRREGEGPRFDYGRVRLWGSISFIIAGFVAGVLGTRLGPGAAMTVGALGALATLIMVFQLPADAVADSHTRKRLTLRHAAQLATAPVFLLFLLAAGLTNAAHATLYVFGAIHWQTLGHPPVVSSLFWVVSIVVEVALFARTADVVRRVSPLVLIAAGAAAGILRWLVMGFDPPFAAILVLQTLHGLTYAATHIGAMHVLSRLVAPELAATAQTLYGTVALGIFMAMAVRMSGTAYAGYAGGAYWLMAALSVIALGAALLLIRRIGPDLPATPVLGRISA
jgi:PPP family 3-phenylpropionic acid transporter